MHPGYQNPDVIGPSGPVDPELIVSVSPVAQRPPDRRTGQLLDALLRSGTRLGRLLRPIRRRTCNAIQCPGASSRRSSASCRKAPAATRCGWTMAGRKQTRASTLTPRKSPGVAHKAYQSIALPRLGAAGDGRDDARTLAAQSRPERLAWARAIVDQMKPRPRPMNQPPVPQNQAQVYAKEAIYLHEEPAAS